MNTPATMPARAIKVTHNQRLSPSSMPRSMPNRMRIGTEILPTIQTSPMRVPIIRFLRWARSVVQSRFHFDDCSSASEED